MTFCSIEIYYDITAVVPDGTPSEDFVSKALDFRNAAMEHIEAALESKGLGEWAGAEIGMGEINFGFDVEDFNAAEAEVRRVVKDTPYDKIREISRSEFDEADFA